MVFVIYLISVTYFALLNEFLWTTFSLLGFSCVLKTMCWFLIFPVLLFKWSRVCISDDAAHTVYCHADLGRWLLNNWKSLAKKKKNCDETGWLYNMFVLNRTINCFGCNLNSVMFFWNGCSPWKKKIRCDQVSFSICTDFCFDLLKFTVFYLNRPL